MAEGETVSYRTANWRPKGLTKQFKDGMHLQLPMWFFTGENADSPDKVFNTLKQEYNSLITSVKGMFAEVFGMTAMRKGFKENRGRSSSAGSFMNIWSNILGSD